MNVLCMGLPFGIGLESLKGFQSRHGHEVRTLAVDGPADFRFAPEESAGEVVDRVSRGWPLDTIMCWVPELFPPPRAIEELGVRTIAAISDWTIYYPQLEHNAGRFDLVLSDRSGSRDLRIPATAPVYLGPLYSHDLTIHYDEGKTRTTDILFAGNLNPAAHAARGKILELVVQSSDSWIARFESGLDHSQYRAALNDARIVINYGLRHEMNLRCFETLACGALLFMEYDNLEIRDLLVEGQDFVSYTPDTLCDTLNFYLVHEEERARIAASGARRVAEITGTRRLDGFLDGARNASRTVRPFRHLNGAQKTLAEILLYASSQVGGQRDLAYRIALDASKEAEDDAALTTASALLELERLPRESRDTRSQRVQHVLRQLQRVTELMPNAIVPWLNLAFVCRRSNQPDPEVPLLEQALQARRLDLGGLLLGVMDDPYYVAWRRALATGTASANLLHACAHSQLASAFLRKDDAREARRHAQASIALSPHIAAPYRAAGRACLDLGIPEQAAEYLRAGLDHTSFDPEMRLALVHALHDMGDAAGLCDLARESARLFEITPRLAHLAVTFREYV